MNENIKRGLISFAISSFAGILVNLMIDFIADFCGAEGFTSMSPDFVRMFPTPVLAAYVNVLLYGVIGFTFAVMTFIYEIEKIGFLYQSIIYFLATSAVCIVITMLLWQLQKYPAAFTGTLLGYAVTHVIMFRIEYKKLKEDIRLINELV